MKKKDRDQIINELIGATVKIDIDYIEANPNPDPAKLRDVLVKEAEFEVLTTMDCKTTLPVGVNYMASRNAEETYEDMKLRLNKFRYATVAWKTLTMIYPALEAVEINVTVNVETVPSKRIFVTVVEKMALKVLIHR